MMAPSPRFDNDDEAAQHWLMVLRDGDAAQKCQAREQLAAIFERRGMFEEATDLLVSNIRDGVRNADVFRWLARLYRAQGDEVTAMQAAAEAAKYMPPSVTVPEPAPTVRPMAQTLPAMPVPEPSPPPAAPVVGPPGACLACGYVNRNVRSTCARCHTPLSAGAVASTSSGVQPAERMSLTTTVGKPRPWYLSTAAIILASSLCIPPLALVFVWMRPWRETVKYAVSAPLLLWSIVWVIGVGGAMVRPSSPPSNSVASTASTSIAAQQPAVAPTVSKPEPTPRPPTAAPAPPTATLHPEPKPVALAKIGQRTESGGIALTVNGVQRNSNAGQFLRAKPGRTYVIADVTIESVTRDNAPYNPLYFKVKDSEGMEYDAGLFGPDNSLKSGELTKGDKSRGSVAFDVPSDAKGLVLSYQPIVIFGGYQTIRIQLE